MAVDSEDMTSVEFESLMASVSKLASASRFLWRVPTGVGFDVEVAPSGRLAAVLLEPYDEAEAALHSVSGDAIVSEIKHSPPGPTDAQWRDLVGLAPEPLRTKLATIGQIYDCDVVGPMPRDKNFLVRHRATGAITMIPDVKTVEKTLKRATKGWRQ